MRVLIVGAGYTGHRLAVDLTASGREVLATRRSSDTQETPYPLEAFDLARPERLRTILSDAGWESRSFGVVFTAGPSLGDSIEESLGLLSDFVEELMEYDPRNFVYLSSTSVYGDADGAWVDETSPLDPVSRSGELKVRCERMLEDRLAGEVPLIRVRPGGIYGPGRNGARRYLDPDYRLVGAGDKWTNRIHVVDLVRALARLAHHDRSTVLNLVDGRPLRLRTLVAFLYRETGRDPEDIRRISWEKARERYSEMRLGLLRPSKRVSSEKLRSGWDFTFRYPDVRSGLRELLGSSEA